MGATLLSCNIYILFTCRRWYRSRFSLAAVGPDSCVSLDAPVLDEHHESPAWKRPQLTITHPNCFSEEIVANTDCGRYTPLIHSKEENDRETRLHHWETCFPIVKKSVRNGCIFSSLSSRFLSISPQPYRLFFPTSLRPSGKSKPVGLST